MRRILLPTPNTSHQHSLTHFPISNAAQSHPSRFQLINQNQYPKLTSNDLNLRHAMRIPQHNTNLRGRRALLRELADLIDDLFGRDFEPGGRGTGVGDRAGRDAFAVAVEATHDVRILVGLSIDFVGFGAEEFGVAGFRGGGCQELR